MSQVTQCPGCGKSLRISDEKLGAMLRCPQCGGKFRASSEDEDEPVAARPRKKKPGTAHNLQPFLRRWMIACGLGLIVPVILTVIGLFSEPVGIAASAVCIVLVLGCVFAGTIWTAIDLGRVHLVSGLAVLLIPAAGPALAFLGKGPARRGAVVLLSSILPLPLMGLMVLVHSPEYRRGGGADFTRLMERLDDQLKPDSPVQTVTLRVASRPGSLDGLGPQCEALLSRFECYVKGSLKIDAPNRIMTYQYRGRENFHMLPAFYLGTRTRAFTPQQRVDNKELQAAQ